MPPIVLLHGIQGTSAAWSPVAESLGGRFDIVLPNLRGRANSFSPADASSYTLGNFADDLKAVVDSVGEPVVLVGWSMGVLVSLTYVATYGQEDLAGLVLASGTAHPSGEAVWFRSRTLAELEREADERARRLQLAVAARPAAVVGAWLSVRQADLRPVLPHIRVPTRILHGAADDECPLAHGRALAAGIGGAEMIAWDGVGHNIMAENPGGTAAAIADFGQDVARRNILAANQ